jgi:hypothetical protein
MMKTDTVGGFEQALSTALDTPERLRAFTAAARGRPS